MKGAGLDGVSVHHVTRRTFCRWVGAASAISLGCSGAPETPPSSTTGRSKVVIAQDPKLRDTRGKLSPQRVAALLNRALQALFDRDHPAEAWHQVVRPGQVVGLKVNCLAGKGASTSVELVEAVCESLQEAGIRPDKIVVWDRLNADLESAGFRIRERGPGVRFIGNDVLGYSDELYAHGKAGSLVCRTLTEVCDVVINLPVLKDHSITGVTIALKNLFGAIHNPNKYHLNAGDPYVADVFMLPPIRSKVRLSICDAFTPVYQGGPSYMPQWMWPFNSLLVSLDPVALDYIGWQLIEQKRAEAGMKPLRELKREPRYIFTAADAQHRLGVCDPQRIQVIRI